MTTWVKLTQLDDLHFATTDVQVPDLDVVQIDRSTVERLLAEAGYEPVESPV